MKIIFLDIDGVLNTRRGWSNRPSGWMTGDSGEFHAPVKRMFEDWLLRNPDVRIVLSSTWRLSRNPYEIPFGWAWRIGKESPLILERIVNVTPRLDKPRGEEIAAWLGRHPTVQDWVIIDDDSDMLPEQLPRFVQTSTSIGLTRAHLKRVEEILND